MTEKFVLIIMALIYFIVCIIVFKKTATEKKSYLFSAILFSMILGIFSLLSVYFIGNNFGNLIKLNVCTFSFSVLGSLPAVASMLFINII